MKIIQTFVVLVAILLICEGATWNQSITVGTLNNTNILHVASVQQIKLTESGSVSLHITGTKPQGSDFSSFSVCLSYGFPPSNDIATWEEGGCATANRDNENFLLNLDTIKTLNVRETSTVNLYISIALHDATEETEVEDVIIFLTGTVCDDEEINVDGTCVATKELERGNATEANIPALGWTFYYVEVNEEITANNLKVMTLGFTGGFGLYNPLLVYIRYGAAPSAEYFDVEGKPETITSQEIEASYPQPGNGFYLIGIYNENNTDITTSVSIDINVCANGTAGENCSSSVVTVSTDEYSGAKSLSPESWNYFVIDLSKTNLFYISSSSADVHAPDAYARIINFPTLQFYDLVSKGGRVNVLDTAQSGSFFVRVSKSVYFPMRKNLRLASKWYVGLYNPTNTTLNYGTWANTPCPNNCNGNGNCQNNVCVCKEDYSGIACENKPTGFKVEYIILIVVGAAIVVSAVIGLIIWAVKRRQRNKYESF